MQVKDNRLVVRVADIGVAMVNQVERVDVRHTDAFQWCSVVGIRKIVEQQQAVIYYYDIIMIDLPEMK